MAQRKFFFHDINTKNLRAHIHFIGSSPFQLLFTYQVLHSGCRRADGLTVYLDSSVLLSNIRASLGQPNASKTFYDK